jgi:hypothetical protein
MKPFNLERALEGYKVMTTDGEEVSQITIIGNMETLAGVVSKSIRILDPEKLYMQPIIKYANLYYDDYSKIYGISGVYDSYSKAHQSSGFSKIYVKTISFEV